MARIYQGEAGAYTCGRVSGRAYSDKASRSYL